MDGRRTGCYLCLIYSYSKHVVMICICVVLYTDLRLVNGDDSSGELQFLSTSGWTPICYTPQFNGTAADIACQQLGYPFADGFAPTIGSGLGIGIINSDSCQASTSQYLFNCVEYQEMTCQTRYSLMCHG